MKPRLIHDVTRCSKSLRPGTAFQWSIKLVSYRKMFYFLGGRGVRGINKVLVNTHTHTHAATLPLLHGGL